MTMTYYAVCNVHGPISVWLEAESDAAARAAVDELALREAIDDARTDAEDALGIGGADMTEEDFAEALRAAGACEVAAIDVGGRHDAPIRDGWSLWRLSLADRVAGALGNDGQRFSAVDGRTLDELVSAANGSSVIVRGAPGAREEHPLSGGTQSGDRIRHAFPDGSAIIVAGDCWDLEGSEYGSMAGT